MDSESDDLGVMLDADGRVTGCPPAIHFDWRCFDLSPLASLDLKALRIDCTATSFPMSAKPSWLASDAEPRCALEQLARRICDFHTAKLELEPGMLRGVEWWSQVRQPGRNAAIGFHWDKDEKLHTRDGLFVFPALATVTYLSDVGGPTAVLDQRISSYGGLEDSDNIAQGCLCWPSVGRHLVFDGRLLHGVAAADSHTNDTRYTFLVNIWIGHQPTGVRPFPEAKLSQLSPLSDSLPQLDATAVSLTPAVSPPEAEPARALPLDKLTWMEQKKHQLMLPSWVTNRPEDGATALLANFEPKSCIVVEVSEEVAADAKPAAKKQRVE